MSKFRGKRMLEDKEHFIKPNQKFFISELIVLTIHKVFEEAEKSVCFEEDENDDASFHPEGVLSDDKDFDEISAYKDSESEEQEEDISAIKEEIKATEEVMWKTSLKKRDCEEALKEKEKV